MDDRSDSSKEDSILQGQLDTINAESSPNVVKIFICSNETDFTYERSLIWEEVLPEIQQHCLHYGLEVQFVDPHQGALVNHVWDRKAFDRSLQELQNCHRESSGPFFLCLVGNRYGPCPLPAYIEVAEFNHIRAEAFEAGKDVRLLDKWYVRDDNSIPPVFALQPVDSKYKQFYNRHFDYQELQSSDALEWMPVFYKLQDLLQHSAHVAHGEGLINQVHEYKQQRYFTSGVEQTVRKALELSPKRCVCILRNFKDISLGDAAAEDYLDLTSLNDRDLKAKKRQERLWDFIISKLNENNKHIHSVTWDKTGLNPLEVVEHAKYLVKLGTDVTNNLRSLIDNWFNDHCSKAKPHFALAQTLRQRTCDEILPHVEHLTRKKNVCMLGAEPIIKNFQSIFIGDRKTDHHPFLVHGQPGSGKTVLLSNLLASAKTYIDSDIINIVRFVGLTSKSINPIELLLGICQQLKCLLKLQINLDDLEDSQLVHFYTGALSSLSKGSKNVFIVIDDIDKLCIKKASLDWLSMLLPARIHIVFSCQSMSLKSNQSISNLRNAISDTYCVEIPKLDDRHIRDLIKETLCAHRRLITGDQLKSVTKALVKEGCPLSVKIMCDSALTWFSKDQTVTKHLPVSLNDAITKRLEYVENKYGFYITTYIACCLLLSRTGLTEMELLDIVSCHDQVLLSCYPNEMPPVLRIPYMLWAGFRKDMGTLLTSQTVKGKTLLQLSHGVIAQAVEQRYLYSTETIRQIHRDIGQLFLANDIMDRPLVAPERGIHIDDGKRLTCPQPLLYSETRYNLRKLDELWYHLLNAGDIDDFKQYSFCNFEYLLAKAHAEGVQSLVLDFKSTLNQVMDAELFIIMQCILQSLDILSKEPLQLANELIGRLRNVKELYPGHLEPLVTQCMQWCDSYTFPLIIPLSQWLPDPHTAKVNTVPVEEGVGIVLPTPNSQHVFCTTFKFQIKMYYVAAKKMIRVFSGHTGVITCLQLSHSNMYLVSGSEDSTIRVWEIASGKNIQVLSIHHRPVQCLALTSGDQFIISGGQDTMIKMVSTETGTVLHSRKDHQGAVTCIMLNTSSSMIVSGSEDHTIKFWCLDDMTLLSSINELSGPVTSMGLSVDNVFLIVCCGDHRIGVHSLTTGTHIHDLKGHRGKPTSVSVSKDSHHTVIGTDAGEICTYNLRSTELLKTHKTQRGPVTSVCISEEEHFIFTATLNQIGVWSLVKCFTKTQTDNNHSDYVTCIAISKDGKLAVSGSNDKSAKLWNLDVSDFMETLHGHDGHITCVAFSPDELFAVTGSEDRTARVWSTTLGVTVVHYKEHQAKISSIRVLNDNLKVLSADIKGSIHVWRADTGKTLYAYNGPTSLLTVAPNCLFAVSGDGSPSMKLWELENGNVFHTICHKDRITCLTFSADSQYLVTGSLDCSLKIWEANTGKLTQVLVEHVDQVSCVTICSSNSIVVSGSHDKMLFVWGVTTGMVEHKLQGHTGRVNAVKLTQDSCIAVSGSSDFTLRVWSLTHGIQLTLFDMHWPVVDLCMTFDANHIIVQLEKQKYVPLLCLHNSPAGEVQSSSQVSLQISDHGILPIRPKPILVTSKPTSYPLSRRHTGIYKCNSESTIPEIVRLSPMSAPMQRAVKAQENNKKMKAAKSNKKGKVNLKRDSHMPDHTHSSTCDIL